MDSRNEEIRELRGSVVTGTGSGRRGVEGWCVGGAPSPAECAMLSVSSEKEGSHDAWWW